MKLKCSAPSAIWRWYSGDIEPSSWERRERIAATTGWALAAVSGCSRRTRSSAWAWVGSRAAATAVLIVPSGEMRSITVI